LVLLLATALLSTLSAQVIEPDLYGDLPYRYIGPDGNRVTAVMGEPGNPNVIYTGWATGGVWKSTNGGINWHPLFDDQDVMTIGAIAMAPSDPNIIWVGTGESAIRQGISVGNGIYKSTDAGKTWQHMGLDATGRISRIVIDPRDPDVVFAGSLGHSWGPQRERGVFRTKDGGDTWEHVLFVDEGTGVSDMDIDPKNPDNVIVGMWPLKVTTYKRTSGGPGGGVYLSRDGGDTFTRLTEGLPEPPTGKVAVRFAPGNPNRVYAMIETAQFDFAGVLWSSDNGGDSWELVSYDHEIQTRAHYYSRLAVAPDDENEIYFLATSISRSLDGGRTVTTYGGGDYHDMWIDPLIPDRLLIGNDRGINISVDRYDTFYTPQLPTGQMYHVSTDNRIPYFVYGNRQDGPSRRGPSNSLTGERIPIGLWHAMGGGESGFSYADPVDPDIIWSGSYGGSITEFDLRTGHARNVQAWPEGSIGTAPKEHEYRWNWTSPIEISPHDHSRIYLGSQVVHMTTNGGQSWEAISPDLTTNDVSKMEGSGGLTEDNLGVDICCTLFAISESPLEEGVIWAGSNDGMLHVTRDGGRNWTNVSQNWPDEVPPEGIVSQITASTHDAGTAYVALKLHRMNNRDPFALKTSDYGRSWKLISGGIPKSVHSYVHTIVEDPVRPGLLFLGTENSVYMSFNDGEDWVPLQNNLPHAPVTWLEIQEHFGDLVVATYGRGFWILDDISPFRLVTDDIVRSEAHLFEPRAAYRFNGVNQSVSSRTPTEADGFNPPEGAAINYYLRDVPSGPVTLTVRTMSGEFVRSFEGAQNAGFNRVYWDLRRGALDPVRLRTLPLGHPTDPAFIPPRLRFNEEGWRPAGEIQLGPRVTPGTYSLTLQVDGRSYTEQIEVRKDPNSAGTVADIRAQNELALQVTEAVNRVTSIINDLEWARKQIADLQLMIRNDEAFASVQSEAEALEKKLTEFEAIFYMLENTGARNNSLRKGGGFRGKVNNVLSGVQSVDFAPPDQYRDMYEIRAGEVRTYQSLHGELMDGDLARFNDMLRRNGLPIIMIPGPEHRSAR
jgi:photosystem II stability/assembly factor-like uncharacterized protein